MGDVAVIIDTLKQNLHPVAWMDERCWQGNILCHTLPAVRAIFITLWLICCPVVFDFLTAQHKTESKVTIQRVKVWLCRLRLLNVANWMWLIVGAGVEA